MLHDSLDTVASASASYVLASQKMFGLGLDLTLSGFGLGLILLWPHYQAWFKYSWRKIETSSPWTVIHWEQQGLMSQVTRDVSSTLVASTSTSTLIK